MPPGLPNLSENWFLPGASEVAYRLHVKDTSGPVWKLNGFGGYNADPCPDRDSTCNSLLRVDQIELGISLDLAHNSSIRCTLGSEPQTLACDGHFANPSSALRLGHFATLVYNPLSNWLGH